MNSGLLHPEQILATLGIEPTPIRIQMLNILLEKSSGAFSISQVRETIKNRKLAIGETSMMNTLQMFTRRGFLQRKESSEGSIGSTVAGRKPGRPVSLLVISPGWMQSFD